MFFCYRPLVRLSLLAASVGVVCGPGAVAQGVPHADQMDPNMLTVLQTLQAIEGTPVYNLAPADARQQFTAEDAARAVARASGARMAPQPVASVVDMAIPGISGVQIPLRVYTPPGTGPFPVVLYFHGGGFVLGTNSTYDGSARAIANGAKAIVVSVEYRKAPENQFPAALEDALTAYYWAITSANTVGGINTKVAVAGESEGGNLAANVAILTKQYGVQQPVRQVLIYPLVDYGLSTPSVATYADAFPLGTLALKYFSEQYVPGGYELENPLVSPLQATVNGVAPATVIAAEIDPLQSQDQQYAQKLQAAGVAVDYKVYNGVTHEFFGMGAVVPEAAQAEAQVAADLKKSF